MAGVKRVFALVLSIIMMLGVGGCMDHTVSSKAKIEKEITEYLEKKYGEKFIVAQLISDYDVSDAPTKAYVYPDGVIADVFTVRINSNENTGVREYSDGYSFVFAEKSIIPAYQALIAQASPDVKITILLRNELDVTRTNHKKDVSFEEFSGKEYPFDIYINAFISADVLSVKDDFFEKLSHVLNSTPGRSFYYNFQFIFIDSSKFDKINIEEFKRYGLFEFKDSVKETIAFAKVGISENMSQLDILTALKSDFTDDMLLQVDGVSNSEVGGGKND